MMSNKDQWLALHLQPNVAQKVLTPELSMIGNRGMAYGDGFFTTMAVLGGEVLWLAYHQQRLITHARALQLDIDSDYLLSVLQNQAEQLQQGMIKLIITRAEQPVRGYGFCADKTGRACEIWLKATAMVVKTPLQLSLLNGNKVFIQPAISAICLTSQLACLPPTLAGLKSLNRLDNVLASGELQSINTQSAQNAQLDSANHKYAEGLVRDMSGAWTEGTMSN
ncbi:MAG: aminotransferase class IV, partial [Psychrobacter sp.]|nr:aminotransferase class IV [Psychrobacter sp.]